MYSMCKCRMFLTTTINFIALSLSRPFLPAPFFDYTSSTRYKKLNLPSHFVTIAYEHFTTTN